MKTRYKVLLGVMGFWFIAGVMSTVNEKHTDSTDNKSVQSEPIAVKPTETVAPVIYMCNRHQSYKSTDNMSWRKTWDKEMPRKRFVIIKNNIMYSVMEGDDPNTKHTVIGELKPSGQYVTYWGNTKRTTILGDENKEGRTFIATLYKDYGLNGDAAEPYFMEREYCYKQVTN